MSLLMLCYYVLTSLIVGSTEFLEQPAKLNGEGANHLTCLDPPDPKSKRKIFPASNLTQAGVGEGLPGQLMAVGLSAPPRLGVSCCGPEILCESVLAFAIWYKVYPPAQTLLVPASMSLKPGSRSLWCKYLESNRIGGRRVL
jgi:hypothetical protein